ncbi:galactose mutarotase-like enzyme [Bacillus niacini]|uniref:Galactose mutarotase-like enzyme n=1 Tax=Neobacillus niacini TaxID=86668 RepID=A0A852TET1_9BACI|nr:aldose 1-epimerase family protein [Neobacillus niacini]NYE05858.1 galactose mutarotase-like enzyme [Neobacillus niacini]
MIVIENDWLKVNIDRHGAEVRKVTHKKNGLDYMWTGDEAYWGRVSPVLFPIVGRLKEDQYQLDGQTYKMSQHGFLRDVEFAVDEQTSATVSFVYESLGSHVHVYPYDFTAKIRYRLEENSLIVQWQILNVNNEEMYFSIGAHPAFKIPLEENETIEDNQVNLAPAPNKSAMEYELKNSLIHEKGIVTNLSTIPLTKSIFAHDALIYSNIDKVTLESKQSRYGVEVMFQGFPFVGIWSKYLETDGTIAPFVFIEPWYGIADTHDTTGNLKEKFGVNKLKAGETFQAEYMMKFY